MTASGYCNHLTHNCLMLDDVSLRIDSPKKLFRLFVSIKLSVKISVSSAIP